MLVTLPVRTFVVNDQGPRRVRVNALAPGYFPTELTGMLADPGFVRN